MRTSTVDKVILEVLSREHSHLTPSQVFEEIKERLPAVNQSTVYRALERLVKSGQVSVSDMGKGAAVYEIVSDHLHHHLVCENCGRVITIDNQDVSQFFGSIREKNKFQVHTNHLVLFGLCNDCSRLSLQTSQ